MPDEDREKLEIEYSYLLQELSEELERQKQLAEACEQASSALNDQYKNISVGATYLEKHLQLSPIDVKDEVFEGIKEVPGNTWSHETSNQQLLEISKEIMRKCERLSEISALLTGTLQTLSLK